MHRHLLRTPSAWAPIAMSIAAAALVWQHVLRVGITREADEGAEARLFQILVLLQVPIVLWFAARWLPERAKSAIAVLALQALALLLALGSLFWFENLAQPR